TAVRFTATSRPEIYPLSLHDALPISRNSWEFAEFSVWTATPNSEKRSSFSAAASCSGRPSNVSNLIWVGMGFCAVSMVEKRVERSEEHTSELQSPYDLVCRLLLEKKK